MSSGLMSLRRLAPAPPRCAGPCEVLASMRTPSMYTIGSVLSDRLPTERTRICAPVPTCPVAGSTMTPGVRAPISCSTLRGAAALQHFARVDALDDVADGASFDGAAGSGDDDLIELDRALR